MYKLCKIWSKPTFGVQDLWAFSLKYLDRPKWSSAKPRHQFVYRWLDNVKINLIMVIRRNAYFRNRQTLVHQKNCYTCYWLDNVDMHLYAKWDGLKPGTHETFVCNSVLQTKVSWCVRRETCFKRFLEFHETVSSNRTLLYSWNLSHTFPDY